ncbi:MULTISPECIES: sterol desaturase family protein [unclassified Gordonia (in: high G+C Gram-positive bacteria)]|uniref:sterol desaturase family protein n=1 Tax=unclassified Gordonia (in: high G+C Gram-positive bacteria) TaxID=2657482 RepID=UPI001962BD22|nr:MULTISPECIES: sterol desaturase family protein [unclassified Gordonia (in: high G+C Gram-positive bacteria)]MBN0972236.1 sterol desaturase family protein [Gordonia sp. BP-119]MBN0983382.1 sterol desaturase family protein [Gordonia sp. BP-94]MCT1353057.1 sterol desaturase family protein [Gordonia sp. p3-SID1431]
MDADHIDHRARRQVAAEERRMRSRRSTTLRAAFAEFLRHPSPWMIAAFLVTSSAARIWLGGWGIADLVVPVVMIASFPLAEWLIHVVVLHWRPKRLGPVTIDPLVARKHREHHSDPRNIPLVFIPWQVLVTVVLAAVAVGLLVFASAERGLTFMATLAAIGLVYEWTHYLIHSDYRPRRAYYRRLWRNHRFHHYRNEHYWFAVTTAGTADRLLHTYPDPDTVEKSPTAKDLHALSQPGTDRRTT